MNADTKSNWSGFEIRMQNEFKRYRFIIFPLKGLERINILERF